jgi:lysyl endopeptidase
MKNFLLVFSAVLFANFLNAQITAVNYADGIPKIEFPKINRQQLANEDVIRDKQGILYRIGVAQFTNITTENSGIWSENPDGSRTWKVRVSSAGAEALSILFQTFKIYGGTTFDVLSLNGRKVHNTMKIADVQETFTQNAALCQGDDLILVLNEPANTQPSEIHIDRIMHNYRSTGYGSKEKINESEACQVNVNCSPVGDTWQDEKKGVARIYIIEGNSAGWCTGSLINNTSQDCKPYFLTALHCGVTTSASNMTQWKFYFRYESPNCTNPSTAGTLDDYFITGCLRIADSGDGGGDSGSDFLLVQLGSASNMAATISTLKSTNFNAYWNGWNANTTATSGGTGIHHPSGDIKKISTASGNSVSSGWNGNGLQSHWRVTWTANSNGHGVTEGGSSGSPYFNNSQGYIVGTLTGGGSFCNALSQPDYYGKMSYHWTSNGTATNRQLKPWLDPTNSGVLTLAGSPDPCSNPVPPVANFVANQTNIAPATTVTFTDQSSGIPTSWAWSISPASGWAYAGGTTASSQNPQITFNTVGQYSVTLTASNAQGSDGETKNNYIIVAQATGPCTPSVTAACDEYIQNVTLNTINNTTTCTTGGYAAYLNLSTSLTKGMQYTITVSPAIPQGAGAYTGDEIAVWIDYNNDFTFSSTERVGYVLVGQGWSNQLTFTVPTTAVTGAVRMRVRLHYAGNYTNSANQTVTDGPINPCAVATYGETEDYTVNIIQGGSAQLDEINSESISVYPNPTSSELYVDLGGIEYSFNEIQLVDLTGRIISTNAVNKDIKLYTISTSSLSNGVYSVKIIGKEGSLTKRIIKQ